MSLVALAITVTLNGVDCNSPVSNNVAVNTPSDSSAEYLESLNPTQVPKFEEVHQVNKFQYIFIIHQYLIHCITISTHCVCLFCIF